LDWLRWLSLLLPLLEQCGARNGQGCAIGAQGARSEQHAIGVGNLLL
jgi:hypothetical protein